MRGALAQSVFALVVLLQCCTIMSQTSPATVFFDDQTAPTTMSTARSAFARVPRDPYDLYVCNPMAIAIESNFGQNVLRTQRFNTMYKIVVGRDKECYSLCRYSMSKKANLNVMEAIRANYQQYLFIDDFPAAVYRDIQDVGPLQWDLTTNHSLGVPFGKVVNGQYHLYNHISFTVYWSYAPDKNAPAGGKIIIDVHALPSSRGNCSDIHTPLVLTENTGTITYSYDVTWEQVKWYPRWALYLTPKFVGLHWASLGVSAACVVVIYLLLAGLLYFAKTKGNWHFSDAAIQDSDIQLLRPYCAYPLPVAVLTGNGVQVILAALFTIFLTAVGFVGPAQPGYWMMSFTISAAFLGCFAGLVSVSSYRSLEGELPWWIPACCCAVVWPVVQLCFVVINDIVIRSSGGIGIPLATYFSIFFLWLCIDVPCVMSCGWFLEWLLERYVQEDQEKGEQPATPPVLINDDSWAEFGVRSVALLLAGGFFPFLALSVEYWLVLGSLTYYQYYASYSYLMTQFFVVLICWEGQGALIVYHAIRANKPARVWRETILSCCSLVLYLAAYTWLFYVLSDKTGYSFGAFIIWWTQIISLLIVVLVVAVETSHYVAYSCLIGARVFLTYKKHEQDGPGEASSLINE